MPNIPNSSGTQSTATSSSIFGAPNIGAALSDFGGAVNDLYAAKGAQASAASYGEAANIATTNASIAQNSEQTQQLQIQRQIAKVGGSEEAAFGMGNMADSGSGLDVMRESMEQGAIAKAAGAQQGAIQVQGYQQQAQQYLAMQDAANRSAHGNMIAEGLQAVGSIAAVAGLL